jgi:hypothetical protein
VRFETVAGQSYYVRAVVSGNIWAVRENLAEIDPAIAQQEIRHCNRPPVSIVSSIF